MLRRRWVTLGTLRGGLGIVLTTFASAEVIAFFGWSGGEWEVLCITECGSAIDAELSMGLHDGCICSGVVQALRKQEGAEGSSLCSRSFDRCELLLRVCCLGRSAVSRQALLSRGA